MSMTKIILRLKDSPDERVKLWAHKIERESAQQGITIEKYMKNAIDEIDRNAEIKRQWLENWRKNNR